MIKQQEVFDISNGSNFWEIIIPNQISKRNLTPLEYTNLMIMLQEHIEKLNR